MIDSIAQAKLIAAHEAHLTELYLMRAKMGVMTPPHVRTEIKFYEDELDRLRPQPQPMDNMTLYRLFITEIMRLDAAIGNLRRLFEADLLARANAQPAQRPRPARRVNGE